MAKDRIRRGKDMSRAGKAADKELAGALLKMIAVGFAGGLAMIAGAKKVGSAYLDAKAKSDVDLDEMEDAEACGCQECPDEEETEAEEESVEPVPVVAELADDIIPAEDTEE